MTLGLWRWDPTGCLIISGGIVFFGPILLTLAGKK